MKWNNIEKKVRFNFKKKIETPFLFLSESHQISTLGALRTFGDSLFACLYNQK